ncbi:expressed unknown protein [Seminavis robusta]|uniref:Uncharacterized protein n=1 Tax=Seminavis robusta TaxID=568900 RepID=A0A9N8E569_9STRA|nr:expressed unknown protein [Seminavis robusta]|eukprot:Sro664_g183630.1 n/a (2608) ;mRNA; f:16110-24127
MAEVEHPPPTPFGARTEQENVDPGSVSMNLRDAFLAGTGQCQSILNEVIEKDEVLPLEIFESMERDMTELLWQGYFRMKNGQALVDGGSNRNRDCLTPQEYYSSGTAMLLAGLFQLARPRVVIETLRHCLDASEMDKTMLSLVLDLRRGHPGLKLETWENAFGFVSTIQSNVTQQQKEWIRRSRQLGIKPTTKESLEAMWIIPFSYIVGWIFFHIWRKNREASTQSFTGSWDADIRPGIDKILRVAFPRMRSQEYMEAGLLLLQVDLLKVMPNETPQVVCIEQIVKGLQNSSVLKLLVTATALPSFTLFAACADKVLGRLDFDEHSRVAASSTKLMRREAAAHYLSKLKAARPDPEKPGESRLSLTASNNATNEDSQTQSHREALLSNEFPLLVYIDTLLVNDRVEDAIDIVSDMELCPRSVLTENGVVDAWCKVFEFLVVSGVAFLDGVPGGRPEYTNNRKILLEKLVGAVGHVGWNYILDAYLEILNEVAELPVGLSSREEQIYVQRACHQTVLRILQQKHNDEQGLTVFLSEYWKHAVTIEWKHRGSWPLLLSSSSAKERKEWAVELLGENNEVPESLKLNHDGLLLPDVAGLLKRKEEPKEVACTKTIMTSAPDGNTTETRHEYEVGAVDIEIDGGNDEVTNVQDSGDEDQVSNKANDNAADAIELEDDEDMDVEGGQEDDDMGGDDDEERSGSGEVVAGEPLNENLVEIDDDSDDEEDVAATIASIVGPKGEDGDGNDSDGTVDDDYNVEQILSDHSNERPDGDGDSDNEREEEELSHHDDPEENQGAELPDSGPEVVDMLDDSDEDDEEEAEVEPYEDARLEDAEAEVYDEDAEDAKGDNDDVHDVDMDMDEAGSQTGYEPEDTHGFTEEEVSEAFHTEDEEEEKLESTVQQPVIDSKESEEAPEPVKRPHASLEPHTLSDMDYADEHTTEQSGQEEDPGAESSELDEADGVPAHFDAPKSTEKASEGGTLNEGGTLMDFARRAQVQIAEIETTTTTGSSRPWHWTQNSLAQLEPPTGDPSHQAPQDDGSLQASETDELETPAKVVVDHVPADGTGADPDGVKLESETPASRFQQASVMSFAGTSAAVGSLSLADSANYEPSDEEDNGAKSAEKVLVDCVPGAFGSPNKDQDDEAVAATDDDDKKPAAVTRETFGIKESQDEEMKQATDEKPVDDTAVVAMEVDEESSKLPSQDKEVNQATDEKPVDDTAVVAMEVEATTIERGDVDETSTVEQKEIQSTDTVPGDHEVEEDAEDHKDPVPAAEPTCEDSDNDVAAAETGEGEDEDLANAEPSSGDVAADELVTSEAVNADEVPVEGKTSSIEEQEAVPVNQDEIMEDKIDEREQQESGDNETKGDDGTLTAEQQEVSDPVSQDEDVVEDKLSNEENKDSSTAEPVEQKDPPAAEVGDDSQSVEDPSSTAEPVEQNDPPAAEVGDDSQSVEDPSSTAERVEQKDPPAAEVGDDSAPLGTNRETSGTGQDSNNLQPNSTIPETPASPADGPATEAEGSEVVSERNQMEATEEPSVQDAPMALDAENDEREQSNVVVTQDSMEDAEKAEIETTPSEQVSGAEAAEVEILSEEADVAERDPPTANAKDGDIDNDDEVGEMDVDNGSVSQNHGEPERGDDDDVEEDSSARADKDNSASTVEATQEAGEQSDESSPAKKEETTATSKADPAGEKDSDDDSVEEGAGERDPNYNAPSDAPAADESKGDDDAMDVDVAPVEGTSTRGEPDPSDAPAAGEIRSDDGHGNNKSTSRRDPPDGAEESVYLVEQEVAKTKETDAEKALPDDGGEDMNATRDVEEADTEQPVADNEANAADVVDIDEIEAEHTKHKSVDAKEQEIDEQAPTDNEANTAETEGMQEKESDKPTEDEGQKEEQEDPESSPLNKDRTIADLAASPEKPGAAHATPSMQLKRGDTVDSTNTLRGKQIHVPVLGVASPMSSVATSADGSSMRSPPRLPSGFGPHDANAEAPEEKQSSDVPHTAKKSNRTQLRVDSQHDEENSVAKEAAGSSTPKQDPPELGNDEELPADESEQEVETEKPETKTSSKDEVKSEKDDASAKMEIETDAKPREAGRHRAESVSDLESDAAGSDAESSLQEDDDPPTTRKAAARSTRSKKNDPARKGTRSAKRFRKISEGKEPDSPGEDESEEKPPSRPKRKQISEEKTREKSDDEGPSTTRATPQDAPGMRRTTRARGKTAKADNAETEGDEQSVARRSKRTRRTAKAEEAKEDDEDEGSIVASTTSRGSRTRRMSQRTAKAETKDEDDDDDEGSIAASMTSRGSRTRRISRRTAKTETKDEDDDDEGSIVASTTSRGSRTRRISRRTAKAETEDEDDVSVAASATGSRRAAREAKSKGDEDEVSVADSAAGSRRSTRSKAKAKGEEGEVSVAASATGSRRATRSKAKSSEDDEGSVASRSTRRSAKKDKEEPQTTQRPTRSRKRTDGDDEDGDDGSVTSKGSSASRKKRAKAAASSNATDTLAPIPEDNPLTSPTKPKPKTGIKRKTEESKTKTKSRGKTAPAATADSDDDSDDDDEPIAVIKRRKAESDTESEKSARKPKATTRTRAKAATKADKETTGTPASAASRRSKRTTRQTKK